MPPEFVTVFLDQDDSLPWPDAVLGVDGNYAEHASTAPSADELMQDPEVQALVEVADRLQAAG